MKIRALVHSAALLVVSATCTYTCWDVANPSLDRFAACTGTTLAPAAAWTGTFVEEDCTDCAYATDRVKGFWPDSGVENWAWVAKSDLSNPRGCAGAQIQAAYTSSRAGPKSAPSNSSGLLGCLAPGLYEPNQSSVSVRGGVNDDGCADHHFQGYLVGTQTFKLYDECEPDTGGPCFWCNGYAYGDVNNIGSVECQEMKQA